MSNATTLPLEDPGNPVSDSTLLSWWIERCLWSWTIEQDGPTYIVIDPRFKAIYVSAESPRAAIELAFRLWNNVHRAHEPQP